MANKSLKKSISGNNLFYKALSNGISGLPLSYILNIIIVIPIVITFGDQSPLLLAAIIAVPFFTVSVIRMYIIDYFWFKYKINVDSLHLIKRLYDWLYEDKKR